MNINVSFSPSNIIKNLLDHEKAHSNPKQQNGVYTNPCYYGKKYIGEIGISLLFRLGNTMWTFNTTIQRN